MTIIVCLLFDARKNSAFSTNSKVLAFIFVRTNEFRRQFKNIVDHFVIKIEMEMKHVLLESKGMPVTKTGVKKVFFKILYNNPNIYLVKGQPLSGTQ